MISEERLRAAAREAGAALDHAPLPEEAHEFSQKYRHTMRQLERHTQRPSWGAGLRRVAVVLLVLLGLGGGWLTVDAQAREVVFGWVSETIQGAQIYWFHGQKTSEESHSFTLSEIPDGYVLYDAYDDEDAGARLYINSESELFRLEYTTSVTSITSLVTDGTAQEEAQVNGRSAAYYPGPDGNSNTLVWQDAETQTLLMLSGFFEKTDLIHYAESVERIEK